MKTTSYLLAPLYLAPALAAPVFHTSTVLVAGSSSKTLLLRPGYQAQDVALDNGPKPFTHSSASSKTAEVPPSSILDADRPLTTEELMALSNKAMSTQPATPKSAPGKVKVSVGTLVVPGGRSGAGVQPMFLVPGYYVPAKPADVWVVGMILSFVMVVVGLEIWRPVTRRVSRAFATRSEGTIRLEDESKQPLRPDVEEQAEEDDSDDEDDMAPFGGFAISRPREQTRSLRLPVKVDEKAGWI